MKRKPNLMSSILWAVFDAVLVGSAALLGITWLCRGLSGTGGSYALPAGIVWLTAAVIWAVRDVREFRKKQQQYPKAPPDKGP